MRKHPRGLRRIATNGQRLAGRSASVSAFRPAAGAEGEELCGYALDASLEVGYLADRFRVVFGEAIADVNRGGFGRFRTDGLPLNRFRHPRGSGLRPGRRP
jgi:hypothetical protein